MWDAEVYTLKEIAEYGGVLGGALAWVLVLAVLLAPATFGFWWLPQRAKGAVAMFQLLACTSALGLAVMLIQGARDSAFSLVLHEVVGPRSDAAARKFAELVALQFLTLIATALPALLFVPATTISLASWLGQRRLRSEGFWLIVGCLVVFELVVLFALLDFGRSHVTAFGMNTPSPREIIERARSTLEQGRVSICAAGLPLLLLSVYVATRAARRGQPLKRTSLRASLVVFGLAVAVRFYSWEYGIDLVEARRDQFRNPDHDTASGINCLSEDELPRYHGTLILSVDRPALRVLGHSGYLPFDGAETPFHPDMTWTILAPSELPTKTLLRRLKPALDSVPAHGQSPRVFAGSLRESKRYPRTLDELTFLETCITRAWLFEAVALPEQAPGSWGELVTWDPPRHIPSDPSMASPKQGR